MPETHLSAQNEADVDARFDQQIVFLQDWLCRVTKNHCAFIADWCGTRPTTT
jgi:hypothetical protein